MPRLIAALVLLLPLAAAAEEPVPPRIEPEIELTLITAWNRSVEFAADVEANLVKPFNSRRPERVQIRYLGGPEVIPQRQMVYALKRGVVDLYFGATTYMLGLAPEGDAFLAASITPAEARATGVYEAVEDVWNEKLNAHFLGWHQTGPHLHIFTRTEPRLLDNGLPDVTGLRIRTSPTYRAFLEAVGANPVDIPSGEVYTALERGTVDAIAWTSTSLSDQGFQKFLKYRIDPGVLGLVMAWQINLDRWRALPDDVRALLEAEALRYEQDSRARFLVTEAEEKARLAEAGMTFFHLPPGADTTYTQLASDAVWTRMAEQVPAAVERLRPLFDPRPGS